MKHFGAPWSKTLVVVTVCTTLLCVAIGLLPAALAARDPLHIVLLRVVPLAFVAWAACFAIRGYSIEAREIVIRRPFWKTRLPRMGLQTAEYSPGAMAGSIRTLGNGGMFSFTGWYRNRALGPYRAYVTDLNRTVVLRYSDRTVVVSPSDPEIFVEELGKDLPGGR